MRYNYWPANHSWDLFYSQSSPTKKKEKKEDRQGREDNPLSCAYEARELDGKPRAFQRFIGTGSDEEEKWLCALRSSARQMLIPI